MSQMLASDLNNPDFAGPVNPDARLAVKFYSRSVRQAFASNEQGRPIFADVDYVTIFVPGDATSVLDTPVREDHKKRFPIQWAHYVNQHGGDSREVGTPLAQWPRITPAQAEELRALKFYTVEQVANASDAALQRINMIAGMSPFAFRDHAQRFLALAREDAVASAAEEKAKAAAAKVAEQEATIAAQQAQIAELAAAVKAMQENQPAARKPGRPRKSEGA